MTYTVTPTALSDVLILEPRVFGDERGFFFESNNQRDFAQATGLQVNFVQDNHSRSARGVLRGLHFQIQHSQGKLVRATRARCSMSSSTCASVPPPSASGSALSCQRTTSASCGFHPASPMGSSSPVSADFLYKTTVYWYPEFERTVLWSDPAIRIEWPLGRVPQLAPKDLARKLLGDSELFA